MVILVIGRFYTESFAQHISETLRGMGHTVAQVETGAPHRPHAGQLWKRVEQARDRVHEAVRQVPLFSRRATARLQAAAEAASADLTIVCHDLLLPSQVDMLRQATSAPVVLWFPDSVWSFGKAMFLNSRYDCLFFKDPYIVRRLRRDLGKPVYYLPECCNPRHHRPISLSATDRMQFGCDVTTAGNLYSYRTAFFEQLTKYNVKIWGNPPPVWMDVRMIGHMLQRQYVASDAKARAFLAAKIVVNNLHAGEIAGVNVRTFEIAAVGAFQLVTWRPALRELFIDGQELVTFTDMADLRRKLDYYLSREDERARIARAGMQRAHRDHTYGDRLTRLLATVSGKAQGFPLPDQTLTSLFPAGDGL